MSALLRCLRLRMTHVAGFLEVKALAAGLITDHRGLRALRDSPAPGPRSAGWRRAVACVSALPRRSSSGGRPIPPIMPRRASRCHVFQRFFEVWVSVGVPLVKCLTRDGPLALGHDHGHIAVEGADREARESARSPAGAAHGPAPCRTRRWSPARVRWRCTGLTSSRRRARRGRCPTTSSMWIHGMYCLPPATGPPAPSLNGVSIFDSAPPLGSRTTPVRTSTTRVSSLLGLLLPGDAHLREESVARRRVLVDALVAARAVVADRAGADEHLRGLGLVDRAGRSASCPGCATARCARGRRRSSAAATFSPARCTTASPIWLGSTSLRTETPITSSPRCSSAVVNLLPIRPLAPVTVTRMSWYGAQGRMARNSVVSPRV